MSEPLRPSTLSEILDRTVQFYRSRFLVFLGISAVPTVVVLVLAGAVIGTSVWWDKYSTASFSPAVAVVLMILAPFSAVVPRVRLRSGNGYFPCFACSQRASAQRASNRRTASGTAFIGFFMYSPYRLPFILSVMAVTGD